MFPQPNPRIHLDLEVETAVLRLAKRKDFSWQATPGLQIDRLLLDGRFSVDTSGLGLDGSAERLLLDGADLSFKQLTISKGSRLEIECGKDGISLYIYEGGVQGLLELKDGRLRLLGNSRSGTHTVQSPVPESFRFSSANNSGHRLHLRLQTAKNWQIHGLQVTDMRFQQEAPPDSNNFVSSIQKGTVELPEIKRKESLLQNDRLHLDKAASTRLRLDFPASGAESFNLLFLGRAASLTAGPDDFEQNLTPSLLTWIYHQKQLYFCWGALVFAYSLLTNLPALFSRR
ncbi:MAG: hypothetical protein D3924_05975 [Candidatus Electrothrix sp. AR4]|nr:hypothetical protein [Candidatus Electrothrix sp. AR4]